MGLAAVAIGVASGFLLPIRGAPSAALDPPLAAHTAGAAMVL